MALSVLFVSFSSPTSKQGRRLRAEIWYMLTVLTNIDQLRKTLRWKTTFSGRQPLVEDDLQWKMTFGGRQPLVGDDPWWKMT